MDALIVSHEIPAPLEVIPAALVEAQFTLVAQASTLIIADGTTFAVGNALLINIHETGKAIEARRVELKRPITALGKLIDEIASKAGVPLDAAKKSLQGRVVAYQTEQRRIADEARRADEEAARVERANAEIERARLQRIADDAHAAHVAAAKARAKAEADELAALLGAPVDAAPVTIEPAPVVALAPAPVAHVALIDVPKASAVQVRRVKRVEITDPSMVPVYFGGQELRPINESKLRDLLNHGLVIPGARLIEVEEAVMARART